MAIRLRVVDDLLVALCAAETDALPGDRYLDDAEHYALAAKFWRDYRLPVDELHDRVAETQKLRDARAELEAWIATL